MSPTLGEGGFEPYLRAVRRYPWIVALVTLAAVAGAGAWLAVRNVSYRATAEVLVTPVPDDDSTFAGLQVLRDFAPDPARVFQTAAAIINSPSAAALAAQKLGPGWSSGQVRSAVSVEPIGESQLVGVQASAGNPGRAVRIADAFVSAALQLRSQALSTQAAALLATTDLKALPPAQADGLRAARRGIDPTLSLLRLAPTPGAPAGSPAWRILVLAVVPGVVLGIAAALLWGAFEDRSRAQRQIP